MMTVLALEFGGLGGVGAAVLILGAVAGALLTIGALARAMWRGVRALWRGCRRLLLLVEVVEERSRELEHNGGSSLKDAVSRIESRVDSLTRRLDDHLGGTL